MNIIVRNEEPKDHRRTEEVARKLFGICTSPALRSTMWSTKCGHILILSRSLPLSSRWTALWRVPFSIPIPKL